MLVSHEAVEVDHRIGGLARHLDAEHHLSGHPEEKNIVAGLAHVGWVEAAHVGRVVGPAQCAERPEPGTEPGVQHIGVLADLVAAAVGTAHWILHVTGLLPAFIAVPYRDAVPPPKLAADAPGPNVLHPVEEAPLLPLGDDGGLSVAHCLHGCLSQRFHIEKPLGADARLDDRVTAFAVGHGVVVGFDLEE